MQALQAKLQEVMADNEALRAELSAFDPEFWEEIEDLKYERHELATRVQAQKETIERLTAQMGDHRQ